MLFTFVSVAILLQCRGRRKRCIKLKADDNIENHNTLTHKIFVYRFLSKINSEIIIAHKRLINWVVSVNGRSSLNLFKICNYKEINFLLSAKYVCLLVQLIDNHCNLLWTSWLCRYICIGICFCLVNIFSAVLLVQ